MSRIGLKPIIVPQGTKVNIDGTTVTVEGKKGKLSHTFSPNNIIKLEDGKITVTRVSDDRINRSSHGLTRTMLSNMVEGVTNGFQKLIEINGVGYKVAKTDKGLTFQIGFCHPVDFVLPQGIEAAIEGTNKVFIRGIDREMVGQVAADIRGLRPADGYKGKGIIYSGEKLRLKPGKAGKTALKK